MFAHDHWQPIGRVSVCRHPLIAMHHSAFTRMDCRALRLDRRRFFEQRGESHATGGRVQLLNRPIPRLWDNTPYILWGARDKYCLSGQVFVLDLSHLKSSIVGFPVRRCLKG